MRLRKRHSVIHYLTILLPAVALAACSDDSTVTTLDTNPTVSINLPDILLEADFVDQDRLVPRVALSNGAVVSMQQSSGDDWTGTINLPANSQLVVTVTWLELSTAGALPLARMTQELTIAGDGTVVQSNTTGYSIDIDTDGDGRANFDELRENTDPFIANAESLDNVGLVDQPDTDEATPSDQPNANDAPNTNPNGPITDVPTDSNDVPDDSEDTDSDADEVPDDVENLSASVDVMVPRVAAGLVPVIDGRGVVIDASGMLTGEWASAVSSDMSGAPLLIDNLMIDQGAEAPDGAAFRRWSALHDGEFLYVLVIIDDNGDRHRDSGSDLANDDSLELFLDGDNSKSSSYDEDDFHRLLPVQLPGADKQSATAGDQAGPNSSDRALQLVFATGPGIGPDGIRRPRFEQDVYELRIDLNSAGIDLDEPFGFELQVNDDDGGQKRESKWAWAHPSRINTDVDGTVSNPGLMGTLKLE